MSQEIIYSDDEIVDAELIEPLSDSTEVAVAMTEYQRDYIDGLRAAANLMEQHPEMVPNYSPVTFYRFAKTKKELAQLGLTLGNAQKSADTAWFNVTRKFGPHSFQVTIAREEVCEKKVIGTVTEEIEVPDPEQVANLPTVKQTTVTEKVEWICPPSLHDLLDAS